VQQAHRVIASYRGRLLSAHTAQNAASLALRASRQPVRGYIRATGRGLPR
jgi:hypothetical protein